MTIHRIYFGRKFYKDQSTGYWSSCNEPKIRAHRWVWLNIHGLIPKGYHIHHKNNNKSDNRIENLELIEASRHLAHHMTKERREYSKILVDKIRPLASEWHRSAEGKAWHRLHALKCKFGKWKPKKYTCKQCQTEYKSKKLARSLFCSNNCKSKWRRLAGFDNETRKCESCDNTFIINKYAKKQFCSRKCIWKMIKNKKAICSE